MTVTAFISVFTVLCLGNSALGLQCYCNVNIGFLPHCWLDLPCNGNNSICFTFMAERNNAIYIESGCWNKDLVLTWESMCAEPWTQCCNSTNCNQDYFDDPSYFPTTDVPTTPTSIATTESEFSSTSTRGTPSGGTTKGIDRSLTVIISSSVSLSLVVLVIVITLVVIVIIYSYTLHRTDKVAAGKLSQLESKLSIDMDSKCDPDKIPPSSVNHIGIPVQQV